MGRIRIPQESSKYWLPKQRFLTVYHYCLQYPEWEDEYNALRSAIGVSGVNYDGMPHGSGTGDPVSSDAMRLADLDMKMQQVKDAVHEVAPEIAPWLLKGVTEDRPFWYLHDVMRMPCEKDMYYDRRRRFYFLMASKKF